MIGSKSWTSYQRLLRGREVAVEAAVRREEKQRVAASAPFGQAGTRRMKGRRRRRRRGTCEFEAWASDLEQIGE